MSKTNPIGVDQSISNQDYDVDKNNANVEKEFINDVYKTKDVIGQSISNQDYDVDENNYNSSDELINKNLVETILLCC